MPNWAWRTLLVDYQVTDAGGVMPLQALSLAGSVFASPERAG